MTPLPTVCILAGGLGTRLGERVADTPKPLLEVAGKPFLVHQLRLLAAHGCESVVLCVGYLGERIERCIGTRQGEIEVQYSYDGPTPLGTLGAIRRALPLLPERFLILYGDAYLRLDYGAAVRAWCRSKCTGMMTVLRNEDRWDRSNVVYGNGRVVAYDKVNPLPEMRWIDHGLGGLMREVVVQSPPSMTDLSSLYQRLASIGELCGYEVRERFYEIGTPASLNETDEFLRGISRPST